MLVQLILTVLLMRIRCLEWAAAECERRGVDVTAEHQRQVMEPFLCLIRFPLMTGQEFCGSPVKSGVLTDAEKCQVMQYLMTREAAEDMPFSRVERSCRSLMLRADKTKACPNVRSENKKRGIGIHDVIHRSKKRLHVYHCHSCRLTVCAVCAEDCHVQLQHQVRYEGKMDSWCSCLVHNCSKIRYQTFCLLAPDTDTHDPAAAESGTSDDSDQDW